MNLSGYTISKRIGRGGQAVVYEAVQNSLGRRVALKVLDPLLAENEDFTRRFLDEGRILANLGHSNVIVIHDIDVEGSLHYITMELVEGGDLKRRIRAGLEPDTALDFLAVLADCLACAHAQHIVHRDIKPANVLFRQDGTLLLTDFGIAKRLDGGDRTMTGTTLGSPSYLSPEQVACRTLDGRADIYSLGAMTFEMLTGRRPFASPSDFETMRMHVSAPVPKLPGELAHYQPLIERMMAKSPDDRFDDATALIAALRELHPRINVSSAVYPRAESDPWATGKGRHAVAPVSGGPAGEGPNDRDAITVIDPAAGGVDDEVTFMNPAVFGGLGGVPAPRRRTRAVTVALAGAVLVAGGAWHSLAGGNGSESALAQESSSKRGAAVASVAETPVATRTGGTTSASASPLYMAAEGAQTTPRLESSAATATVIAAHDASTRAQSSAMGSGSPATRPGERVPRIDELLARARMALDDLRLTIPEGDSALDYYRQVLAIDPGNRESLDGHVAIADRYASLAQAAASRGETARARQLVGRGLAVDPDAPELLALHSRLTAPTAPPGDPRSAPDAGDGSTPRIQGESPKALLRRVKSWFQ